MLLCDSITVGNTLLLFCNLSLHVLRCLASLRKAIKYLHYKDKRMCGSSDLKQFSSILKKHLLNLKASQAPFFFQQKILHKVQICHSQSQSSLEITSHFHYSNFSLPPSAMSLTVLGSCQTLKPGHQGVNQDIKQTSRTRREDWGISELSRPDSFYLSGGKTVERQSLQPIQVSHMDSKSWTLLT